MLPIIDETIGDNVHREAIRDLVGYVKTKAVQLNKENPVLSEIVYALAKQTAEGDDVLMKRVYFALLVAINVINTQLEVDDLNSWDNQLTEEQKMIELLKELIVEQSAEIKELKKKLQKYEPEDLTTDDDMV